MADPKIELQAATLAIGKAAAILQLHMDLFARFAAEGRLMESLGPIVEPTLFSSSERRAAEAVLAPVFTAAQQFVRIHQAQIARSLDALAKVNAHG